MIITLVNIVGGILIGISPARLPAREALQEYGILTIGDGLVSQIPSLLVSISAGVLITRSGDSDDVSAQIGQQFFAQPKALMMAAVLIFLFALVPGFPKIQLFTLALAVGGFGFMLKRIAALPRSGTRASRLPNLCASRRPRPDPKHPRTGRRKAGTISLPPCPSFWTSPRTWAKV